jgi:type I restriction enzyme S subunit
MKSDWIETTEFSITPAGVKNSATNILPAGTVVVASRVGLGKVCRVRQDTAINQDLRGFTPKASNQIDPQYLFLWFKSIADQIVAAGTGATVQGVTLPFLRSLKIPLPPLEEQRRIVAVLDEAFTAITTATANAEKNLANARELLTAAARQIFDQPPCDWNVSLLGDLCEIYQPQTIGRKDMVDGGPYVVFGANGMIGRYDQYNHEEPQLLVTCRGATCGSINISEPFSWITGNAMVVRPRDNSIRVGLIRAIFQHVFDFSKVITGAAQPQITRQTFAPAKIAFPTSLEQQAAIEAKLDALDEEVSGLIEHYQRQLASLAELKQSLLHRAFIGELTATAPDLIPA